MTETAEADSRDLTLREYADMMGVHYNTALQHARDGELPGAYHVGRLWRVSRRAVDRMRNGEEDFEMIRQAVVDGEMDIEEALLRCEAALRRARLTSRHSSNAPDDGAR